MLKAKYYPLSLKACQTRLEYLRMAMELASGTGFLSTYQRWMIHKERAALYECIRKMEDGYATEYAPCYQINLTIENIITRIYNQFK
jgi:hypothetical protein